MADAGPSQKVVSATNVQHNVQIVHFVRSAGAILAGCASGVLGLTGLLGFLFYALVHAATTLAIFAWARFRIERYFIESPAMFALDGLSGQLVSYLLFWTLFYALVHLY